MPIARKTTVDTPSGSKPVFLSSFVRRTHEILKLGYDRLDSPRFAKCDEEGITGELVRSMQDALESRTAPRWAKNFWAVEETRVNDSKRLGKRRLRIDIEIVKHQHGPRRRFRFEAKRLRDAASRREYLGNDGLGCFLDGRYARDDGVAGMLGYVQADTINAQAHALEMAIAQTDKDYGMETDGKWKPCRLVKGLSSYETKHRRKGELTAITLVHSLLLFC